MRHLLFSIFASLVIFAYSLSMAGAAFFTHSGKAIVTNRIIGSGTEPKYIGWGTGAVAAAASATGLSTESSETRATGTGTRVTVSQTNDTYQVVGTLTATGSRTITNVATFDAVSSGNICVIADVASTVLATGEGIEFTIKLQFT